VLQLHLRDDARGWSAVDRDEILFVAPPPHAGTRQRRLHRLKSGIEVRVGPYLVSGVLHLPLGSRVDASLLYRQPGFWPVTSALVRWEGDDRLRRDFAVVIINSRHISEIRPLIA
jgi:hypothetical protein